MTAENTSDEFLERIQKLSPRRLALLAAELQKRLAEREAVAEPIAVIGVGCRMPGGADTPNAFWELLANGIDAIEEVPATRWDANAFYDPRPDTRGKSITKWGGFVGHIEQFDAAFFGIAPREAVSMDPQQRMLLEVSWEALENACVRAELLNGSPTGVFLGISTNDYHSLLEINDPDRLDAYTGSGSAHSVAGGRLSYFLGLKGPNLSIDTACSSSGVAIHVACQSLRQNECRLALAGGVNATLLPHGAVALSQAHMLASDGRCKAFSESADGFVRSEGCGVLVLKRLTDAQADGDRILGVIRGSAVNHDGRTSGLSAPNGPAQEAVVMTALKQAGLTPKDIDYIESHGTGTVLGDAIELGALGAVFGEAHSDGSKLTIGSVKTNIGHLESSAGVAGVIKVLLTLQHELIPAHLHVTEGRENEALKRLPLKVPLCATPWPATGRPRVAGVSSFGFSGTNAHIVISEAPRSFVEPGESSNWEVITVSAKTEAALSALCARHADHLRTWPETSLADLAFTLNAGRSHFQHRIALLVASTQEAADQLQQIANGDVSRNPNYRFIAGYEAPSIGFLFTGQGSQYPGMGRVLYARNVIFRAAIDRCDKILNGRLPHKLSVVLSGEETASADLIHDTTWTQPALFAFEYALAMLWRSWGVRPSAVLGHSLGEYVAACIAGVFPLESALTLAYERGRLMGSLPRSGAMLAIRANEEEIAEVIQPFKRLSIAAVNGSKSVVVSGDSSQIAELRALLTARSMVSQPLTVSHAFHSELMEPILDEFEMQAAKLISSEPQISLVSNVTGRVHSPADRIDARYWRRHLRGTVRFAEGFASMMSQQPVALLEIGPEPVLLSMAKPALAQSAIPSLPSLRRGKDALPTLYEALRQFYLLGVSIDWDEVYRDRPARKLALPTYPFLRQRYWVATEDRAAMPKAIHTSAQRDQFDKLLHITQWQPQSDLVQAEPTGETPSILFLGPATQSDSIVEGLQRAGIIADELEARGELLQRLRGQAKVSSIVLELAGAREEDSIPELALENSIAVLEVLQAVIEKGAGPGAIWLVTRGAAAIDNDTPVNLSSTIADAIAKTARLEHPELEIRCVDLPSQPSELDFASFARLLREGTREHSFAIRQGASLVPRLVALDSISTSYSGPLRLIPGAAYLVTGAYGGLGFRTVLWMVDRGAACIFMVGRRVASAEIRGQIAELRQRGVQIHSLTADMSKRRDVEQIFTRIAETQLDLRGIVHAAGVIDDGTLRQQTPERFSKVFGSKVQGGWALHELSQTSPLDFFVLFGSAASVMGSPGQSNYAAANGFLEGLSHFRQQQGLPSTTIEWGAWSEIGMAVRVKDTGRGARLGVGALSPEKGVELLKQAIECKRAKVAALPIDWKVYLAPGNPQSEWPFFELLLSQKEKVPTPQATAALRSLLDSTPIDHRLNELRKFMRGRIVRVLGLDSGFVLRDDQPLAELGLDSLMALELKNELQASLGETLSPNFFFEFPTVEQAAMFLNAKLVMLRDGSHPDSSSSEYEELAI